MSIPVPGWHGPLCFALTRILARPPAEAHVFRHVLSHASRYGNDLVRHAEDQPITRERKVKEYSLATFALSMPAKPRPIETTLAWLVLEAHLSYVHENLAIALTRIVRGLTRPGASKLADTVAECRGPSQLLAKMARLSGHDTAIGITGHKRFDALWRDELMAFCASLIRVVEPQEPAAETESAPLNQPGALTENPTDRPGEDADEGPSYPARPVHPEEKILGRERRHALDWSVFMGRQSSPDLLRSPDNVLPQDLRECSWLRAMQQGNIALANGDLEDAEYQIATVLSVEAGLSSREAVSVGFGSTTRGAIPVIDLSARVFRRPESLPPNYFVPEQDDDRWMPTGGDVVFPLSAGCTALAKALLDARAAGLGARSGKRIHSLLLSRPLHREKLRAATKPDHRLVLAASIADAMGIDASQRAFNDTFGLSTAPVFYGAYPALDLARTIASINGFAGPDQTTKYWAPAADHWLGSRVRPKQPPYANVWAQLGGTPKRSKGRPSTAHLSDEWRRSRDRLAIHFLLATGHRPTDSLAGLTLHDFLPGYALAVVRDKVSDPSHATRLVCTGRRFVGELESFVAELHRVSRNGASSGAAHLASSILAGEESLFSIPTSNGSEPIDIRDLLRQLDPLWGYRPNLHRHGLCQFLIQRKIDPELRYFQMGWLSHDHHATSESAPSPPKWLGEELAPILDEWLDQCGWPGGAHAKHPDKLIPLRPLIDWEAKQARQTNEIRSGVARLRAEIREAGRDLEKGTWQQIQDESARILADFNASGTARQPSFVPRDEARVASKGSMVINGVHVQALLAPFARPSCSAAERYVAAKLLRKALLHTATQYGVRVHLPEVPVLSRHRQPSPFLPGMGLAVSQLNALQSAIVGHLANLGEIKRSEQIVELAAITIWSMILHTPCRGVEDAVTILRAANESHHADLEPWLLRLPYGKGHVSLMGDQAALLCRFVKCSGWKTALETLSRDQFSALGTFARKLVPRLCPDDLTAAGIVQRMTGTAHVAKMVALNGADRLILNRVVNPVTVPTIRAAATVDNVTISDDSAVQHRDRGPLAEPPPVGKKGAHRSSSDIADVMRAFSTDFTGEILGMPADPVAARRRQLRPLLERALSGADNEPTAPRLMLEYAWHLLVRGGPRSNGGQAISTIYKTYHHVEPVLRNLEKGESLEDFTSVELTAICRIACKASKRKSSRDVLGSLRLFFGYASRHYRVAIPEWGILYREYGVPSTGGDPALIGDAEANEIIDRLYREIQALDDSDADPAEQRYRETRLVAALIGEASAARPGSIYGLTLEDIVLGVDRDHIHLKSRGRFASIKTETAAGYIPLDGAIWAKYVPWFTTWFHGACTGLAPDALEAIPLFQIPGKPIGVRYERNAVFGDIGELVRWRTQQSRGRTYWLRKRRIRARHLEVLAQPRPLARDMAHAMRVDGQALLLTPLGWYLSEPSAYNTRDLSAHAIASRAGAAAITGLGLRQVDAVTTVHPYASPCCVGKLLRLGLAGLCSSKLPASPELSHFGADLTWSSIDRILRDLVRGHDVAWVAKRQAVQLAQAQSVADAGHALAARLNVKLGTGAGELGPPRRTTSTNSWYELLSKQDQRLLQIAKDWADVAGTASPNEGCRLYDSDAIGLLKTLANEIHTQVACDEPDGLGRRMTRFTDQDGGAAYGVWRVVRWLFVIAWISEFRLRLGKSISDP